MFGRVESQMLKSDTLLAAFLIDKGGILERP
jgi:hypothetical protein